MNLYPDHKARVAAWEANDCQHPDLYKFKMAFRDAVLSATDECSEDHSFPMIGDQDLPELFKALDAVSERLFLRRFGITA